MKTKLNINSYKENVIDNIFKNIDSISEYINDMKRVNNVNSKNAIEHLLTTEICHMRESMVYVNKLMNNMEFKKEIAEEYCKHVMKEYGFTYPEDSKYDSTIQKTFTPVSKQDLEAIGNPDPMHINDIIDEGMREYGYTKNDNGEWVESTSNDSIEHNDNDKATTDDTNTNNNLNDNALIDSKKKSKTSKRKTRTKTAKSTKKDDKNQVN